MGLSILWTRFAENKLEDIYKYYRKKAGKSVSKKLVNGIINSTIELTNSPFIGQLEQELIDRPQEFRYLIYKNYKII